MIPSAHFEVSADTVAELQEKIEEQRKKIEQIDKEIAEKKKLIAETQGEAKTLQAAIAELERAKAGIEAEIRSTEANIAEKELNIEKIGLEINHKEKSIKIQRASLSESLQKHATLQERSMMEFMLSRENLSEYFLELDSMLQLQDAIDQNLKRLYVLRVDLEKKEDEEEKEKSILEQFKLELSSERKAVADTQSQKDRLLQETKNRESEYQRILNEKVAQRKEIEEAMLAFEAQLQSTLDPSSLPKKVRGLLAWPVRNFTITQLFGGTQFAKNNTHVYGRPFHPGTDFGVPTGTKVAAVDGGTVMGTGNTDAVPGCYSWGKWVLIKHPNGLASLYAHLSSIGVNEGDSVSRGQVVGYSGATGYATGPHLHLTLYASKDLRIRNFEEIKSSTGCAGAKTPTAPLDAYLDPMSYLPEL